jgi:hypothetical protein
MQSLHEAGPVLIATCVFGAAGAVFLLVGVFACAKVARRIGQVLFGVFYVMTGVNLIMAVPNFFGLLVGGWAVFIGCQSFRDLWQERHQRTSRDILRDAQELVRKLKEERGGM